MDNTDPNDDLLGRQALAAYLSEQLALLYPGLAAQGIAEFAKEVKLTSKTVSNHIHRPAKCVVSDSTKLKYAETLVRLKLERLGIHSTVTAELSAFLPKTVAANTVTGPPDGYGDSGDIPAVAQSTPVHDPEKNRVEIRLAGTDVTDSNEQLHDAETVMLPAGGRHRTRRIRWGLSLLAAMVVATMIGVGIRSYRTQSDVPYEVQEKTFIPKPTFLEFKLLTDIRHWDLRNWKPVPANQKWKKVSSAVLHKKMTLMKTAPTDEVRLQFGTNSHFGFEFVCNNLPIKRVEKYRRIGDKKDEIVWVFHLVLDVEAVPLNSEFTVEVDATEWNTFQEDSRAALTVPAPTGFVAMTVTLPPSNPFQPGSARPIMYDPATQKEMPFPTDLVLGKDNLSLAFELKNPQVGMAYRMVWNWTNDPSTVSEE